MKSIDVVGIASLREPPSPSPPPRRSTRMRRSPSAPDLQHVHAISSKHRESPRIWLCDQRLHNVKAQDWRVTYVNDVGFRNIICSYLVWDHPSGRPFDEDDFLNGLDGKKSDSCSELLVHVILAYGSVSLNLEKAKSLSSLRAGSVELLACRPRNGCCCPQDRLDRIRAVVELGHQQRRQYSQWRGWHVDLGSSFVQWH